LEINNILGEEYMSEENKVPETNKSPEANKAPEPSKTSTGLQQNVAGLLCYLLGWITGIIFLILEKDDKVVRFHAIQSIVVFGAYTVITIIFRWIPFIGWIIVWIAGVIAFILWIVLMVKAYQGQTYKVPVAGDIAAKQTK
jgi:uncharacterized membrane protein